MGLAFAYAKTSAIATEASYPYHGSKGSCVNHGGSVAVTSYAYVTANNVEALKTAVARHPVSIAIEAD